MPAQASGRRRASSYLIMAGLYGLFVAANSGRNESADAAIRLLVTREIWTEGRISVSAPSINPLFFLESPDGRWVVPYGIGQSLLFIPFDMAGAALERLAPEKVRSHAHWIPFGFGLLPFIGVLWWSSLRGLLEEFGLDPPWPTLTATALVLCSIALHYIGEPQEEPLIGLLLALGCREALRAGRTGARASAAVAGLCAGLSLITRLVSGLGLMALPAALLAGAVAEGSRRGADDLKAIAVRLSPLVAWMLPPVIAVSSIGLVYNKLRFGSVFSVGYDRLGHLDRAAWDSRAPGVFVSLLVGPGSGFLVLSPILWIAAFGLLVREGSQRVFVWGSLFVVLAVYLFFSGWHDSYTGGDSWGTRYQVHLISLFAVPLALGARRLWEGTRIRRAVLILLVVASALIQVISTALPEAFEYVQASCRGTDGQLLTGVSNGQLAMRAKNVVRMALGSPVPWENEPNCPDRSRLEWMWSHYAPNYWGPVYGRRLPAMRSTLLAGWALTACAGFTLVAAGVARSQGIARAEGA